MEEISSTKAETPTGAVTSRKRHLIGHPHVRYFADVPRRNRFGALLRNIRKGAGFRLGEFAAKLGVSTTYLSDVELGKRSPFGDKTLRKVARLLDCDLDSLRIEAAQSRGAFALSPKTVRHREVGAALMRTWERLDDKQLAELAHLTTKWQEELDDT